MKNQEQVRVKRTGEIGVVVGQSSLNTGDVVLHLLVKGRFGMPDRRVYARQLQTWKHTPGMSWNDCLALRDAEQGIHDPDPSWWVQ